MDYRERPYIYIDEDKEDPEQDREEIKERYLKQVL